MGPAYTASETSALVSNDGADSFRIPYSVTVAGGTTIGTAFSAAAIPAAGLSKVYAARVTGGSAGETVDVSITYGAENTSQWFSDYTYSDTITLTLSAN